MSKRRKTEDTPYEVGYGKPPKNHQFKKGQSGNPRGRPPKEKRPLEQSLGEIKRSQTMLKAELYRNVTVRNGDSIEQIPLLQAMFRSMCQQAIKGNRFNQRRLIDLIMAAENDEHGQYIKLFEAAVEHKTNAEKVIRDHKERGLPPPEIYPHPDHVEADPRTGRVRFTGPMSKEEKEILNQVAERRDLAVEAIEFLEGALEKDPDNKALKKKLAEEKQIYRKFSEVMPKKRDG